MNIYVIKQEAEYDEYEGFTVAAHDEPEAQQVIRDFICPPGKTEYFNPPGETREMTDAERDRYMKRVWPTTPDDKKWRIPLNRTVRLIGQTAPDITEPTVLLRAYMRG